MCLRFAILVCLTGTPASPLQPMLNVELQGFCSLDASENIWNQLNNWKKSFPDITMIMCNNISSAVSGRKKY
jgi:hypothetical protein